MNKSLIIIVMTIAMALCSPNGEAQTWQELLEQADSLSGLGNHDSALVIGRIALVQVEGLYGTEDTSTAKVLYFLGELNYYLSDIEQAVALTDSALAIRENTLGPNHPDVAESLNNLAYLYKTQGRYSEAEPLFDRALTIWETAFGPDHPKVATSLNNLGLLYHAQGRYSEIEQPWKRALVIHERSLGPDHPHVATSLNNLAELYKTLGRYSEAKPLLERALAIREQSFGPGHVAVARSLSALAGLRYAQGLYLKAEPLYERALSILEHALGPDHLYVSTGLNNLAELFRTLGRYSEAGPLYERALAINETNLGLNHPDVARSLNNLALLLYAQLRYSEAKPLYERALPILENVLGPDHPNIAYCLNNLADLYEAWGRYSEAEPLYKRALAILEKNLGPDHASVATGLNNLAGLHRAQGKHLEAELLFERALAILENALGPDHPDVATNLTSLAELHETQGRYSEAELLYERALAVRESTFGAHHPNVANSLELMASLRLAQNEVQKAIRHLSHAFEIRYADFSINGSVLSERDALDYSLITSAVGHRYLTCFLLNDSIASWDLDRTADIALMAKGLVSEVIFDRVSTPIDETDSAAVELAESLRDTRFRLSKLYVDGPSEDIDSYRKEADSLESVANDLEADLSRQSTRYRKRQDGRNVNAERISKLLPVESALVEYLKIDSCQSGSFGPTSRYLAVVIRREAGPVTVDLGRASEIESLVEEYRQHQQAPSLLNKPDYKRISQGLFERIWKPIEQSVSGADLLLVAPDGSLNMIAFAGLMDAEGRYLVEKHTLHYLSAGRDVIRWKDAVEPNRGLLALGDPDFDATALTRLSTPEETPADTTAQFDAYAVRNVRSSCGDLKDITVTKLPNTRREVESIKSTWEALTSEPATAYFGSEASEEKFKAEAPGKRVTHLATHGYFLEGTCKPDVPRRRFDSEAGFVGENPLLLSGLFLAGANLHGAGADSLGAEDGILTAYEVSALDLTGTDMVVLSACETGLGKVEEGEGVYGLRRAFQMAGARTVVSALWPVSDKATAELMEYLYSNRGQSIAESMREYALEKITYARGRGIPDHPYYWAPFIAIGDWAAHIE